MKRVRVQLFRVAVSIFTLFVTSAAQAATTDQKTAPRTVSEWLVRQHEFLSRYIAVLKQARHDQPSDKTLPLLMPVAMDLFTGYVVYIHEMEERLLYPAIKGQLTTQQLRVLQLIEDDRRAESQTVKRWESKLEEYEQGEPAKLTEVVESIDYLAQMLNRHLVLQQQHLWTQLDGSLKLEDQEEVLKGFAEYEQRIMGQDRARRYEQLLSGIENTFHYLPYPALGQAASSTRSEEESVAEGVLRRRPPAP